MNPPQTKWKLKDKVVILQGQDTQLFRREFQQKLVETVNATKQSIEVRRTHQRGMIMKESRPLEEALNAKQLVLEGRKCLKKKEPWQYEH